LQLLSPQARLDVAEAVQQVREAEGRQAQHARGLAGVEQVRDEYAKIALQPQHIMVRAVEHLGHLARPRRRRAYLQDSNPIP